MSATASTKHRHHATNKCAGVVLIDPWHENPRDVTSYRILVIQQKYSRVWGLPKGHLELNEDVHTAALRECAEETGVHIGQLVEGVDYLRVPLRSQPSLLPTTDATPTFATKPTKPTNHTNHLVIKKIHFYAFVLLHTAASLVHSTHDTKEVDAISWMNVHRCEIEPRPRRLESHVLPNGHVAVVPTVHDTPASATAPGQHHQQPPRFNRTLADTSVLALQAVCVRARRCVMSVLGEGCADDQAPPTPTPTPTGAGEMGHSVSWCSNLF